MSSTQAEAYADLIRTYLPANGGDLDRAIAAVRTMLRAVGGAPDEAELASATAMVRAEIERDVEIPHPNSMLQKRPKWYRGPRPGDLHWSAHRGYLENVKKWRASTVRNIDDTSTEVVSLLDDPSRDGFACRGLVVGHVQSGKTANMTAVIAKAVDAGYNVVIILAGLTDKLRQQTQGRMEKDLVRLHPHNWQRLTTTDIKGDFRRPAHGSFMHHIDKAQIAVVKKNVGPLGQLLKTVEATTAGVRRQLRVLVIDDEADQASPNAASHELDMTAINEKIRELIGALPAVSYVGYTATPFANVFISPYGKNGGFDDLYPKDFITALPQPEGYFGTVQLFGRPPAAADAEIEGDDGLNMIRSVPEKEEKRLQPASRKERDSFRPEMVPSLERAILYFLACCAARRARGHVGQHMTMLVHTSAYVVLHDRLAALIEGWVHRHARDVADPASAISGRLRQIWEAEADRLPSGITDAERIPAEELQAHLPAVLAEIEIPIENGSSEDRIDYSGPAKTYIVVGGSVLARGLTLEGLMVSYFLRTANQYDTLLQMGRWFGYRPGYEDLPCIWMPDGLKLQFRALAAVEAEIREEIADYARHEETPMDFAVKVRAIPSMAITAANKMRAAVRCDISYWGRHVQTTRFDHRDTETVDANWQAADHLVSQADSLGLRTDTSSGVLFERVPRSLILQFLREYRIDRNHRDLSGRILHDFIAASPMLSEWNVGVVEPEKGERSDKPLGSLGSVRLSTRSRLRDEDPEQPADIKALMSRRDILFDCPRDTAAQGRDDWDALKEARRSAGRTAPCC